jgi:hypothetical protein
MELYAALDVSLQKTSVCVLDRDGRTVLETVVASEPEALAACLVPYSGSSCTGCGLTEPASASAPRPKPPSPRPEPSRLQKRQPGSDQACP